MRRRRLADSAAATRRYSAIASSNRPASRYRLATASWRSGLSGSACSSFVYAARSSRCALRRKSAVRIGFVGGGARDHLDPEIAHLVRRVLSPDDARGRTVRVARIAGRVVVGVAHRDRRALRQHERRRVAIHVLPAEIPVVDRDEPARGAVGQRRRCASIRRARLCACGWTASTSTSTGSTIAVGDDVLARRRPGCRSSRCPAAGRPASASARRR